MKFTINGREYDLSRADVEAAMRGIRPDAIQKHSVLLEGLEYPVKQVLAAVTRLPRTDFTSQVAQGVMRRLGLPLSADGSAPLAHEPKPQTASPATIEWAWEGHVQDLFAAHLVTNGWEVTSMADTASKQHGVDLLARKGERLLGAEVKGWPSSGYADVRRAQEVKKTSPTTQAGHWFSQALMKAVMLLDSHADHESLVVVPDYSRYRDLARRTRTGSSRAGIHIVFVSQDGNAASESWAP